MMEETTQMRRSSSGGYLACLLLLLLQLHPPLRGVFGCNDTCLRHPAGGANDKSVPIDSKTQATVLQTWTGHVAVLTRLPAAACCEPCGSEPATTVSTAHALLL